MPGEMIAKILSLLASLPRKQHASKQPVTLFQRRFEWQSEFLFVPTKPSLRDDTQSTVMTPPVVEGVARKTDVHAR